ncbi:MAG TPA: hypothetical protein VHD55_03550 [Candidatus Paceibacterota bacterium]|nr:hypothetical protein [Candidatus Paceibacterota bacterium]
MKKHLALFAIGAVFLLPQPAAAASLTQAQVIAIVSLLQSFGADSSVIANVQKSLGGTSITVSNTCKSNLVVTADTDTVNLKVDNSKDRGNVVFTLDITSCKSFTSSAVHMLFDKREAYLPIDTSGTKQSDGTWRSTTDATASGSMFRTTGEHLVIFDYQGLTTSLVINVKP